MKKTKITNTQKSRQCRKHPIGRRFMVGLLCICLSLVSLPIDHYGYLSWASGKQEIVEFSPLPENVRRQMVFAGTSQEELNLPKELEVICRSEEEESYQEEEAEPGTTESSELPEGGEAEGVAPAEQEASLSSEENAKTEYPDGTVEGKSLKQTPESPEEATNLAGEMPESPEEAASPSEEAPESPEETDANQMETLTIQNVTWVSEPEYDKEAEQSYVFTPVLPEVYSLAEGAQLPEIVVSVVSGGREEDERSDRKDKGQKTKKIRVVESTKESEETVPMAEPGCGVISQDTVWPGNVTLADGELVVEPGVTLTIQGVITVQGNVTIRGGGTILRGSGNACFKTGKDAHLTVADVTLDGASLSSGCSMIEVVGGNLILDDGCTIKNCTKTATGPSVSFVDDRGQNRSGSGAGAAVYLANATGVFYDIVLESNCSTTGYGGAVCGVNGILKVYGGTYRNNKTTERERWGGGCFYNICSKFYIYGGRFIGNSSTTRGGAITVIQEYGSEAHLYGGYFEGNTCGAAGYEGSGAVFFLADFAGASKDGAVLELSGNLQFCGNGVHGSGVDGVYLDIDPRSGIQRKIKICDTLTRPVTLYLKASEGYVIAEGTNEYILLHERDMKKIHFVDVGGSGKQWYAVLDKENNQVYLSENKPDYGYYVYYISNGAEGTVVDDAKDGKGYAIGDTATVQSAEPLSREGYYFKEWNTQADGKGQKYQPGAPLEIHGDTDLYAIFEKGKTLSADFYSGSAGQKERESVELDKSEKSGKITAPHLAEMEEWNALGWSTDSEGYRVQAAPEEEITLTEDKEYYGIYEKDVTLSYVAENAQEAPEDAAAKRYANVHEEVTTSKAQFSVAPAAVRLGYAFAGWNTQADGEGKMYKEGDTLEAEEDMTLYAVFKRPLHAAFYSGSAGQKEMRVVEIPEDGVSGTIEALELKEFKPSGNQTEKGWEAVGWDLEPEEYSGEIKPGEELTLTDDTSYYGVYRKEVNLTYEAPGAEGFPREESGECRASVHDAVSYDRPVFTLLSAPVREGYMFRGWAVEADGGQTEGETVLYPAESRQEFTEDVTLYAVWEKESASYRVEHYIQELEGDGYVLAEGDTGEFSGTAGDLAEAKPREYKGFTENTEHALRCASGRIKADGSLILRLYYDRNVYHVDFDVNGGSGEAPESQDVRYGACLQTVDAPKRAGYNFKGWYLDKAGSNGKQWDFARAVEENTEKEQVTLYAKWADETAPVLGKASYGKGHKDLFHWILQRERLKITVPLTEEGSGVKYAEYVLEPEETGGNTEKEGRKAAQGVQMYASAYGTAGLPFAAVNAGGKINRTRKGRARILTRDGQVMAEFQIAEDFKGTVSLTAGDWAGNVSAEKTLTAKGGGVIVEDNAPDIRFTQDPKGQYEGTTEVGVEIKDAADGNISGGIAAVSYQLDNGKKVSLPGKAFREGIVESYWFTMKLSGAGSHSLRVTALDNAGNESSRQVTVDIRGKSVPPGPGPEPKTGDSSHVEIYATASMIAGFTYLLLYFREHGMSEEKKEELVSRLINWAKGKGGIRRVAALVLIFLLLAYYHSIGKDVPEDVYIRREMENY